MTTHVSHHHAHLPHVNAWLVAVGVAILLVVAVGGGVLIGRATKTSSAPVKGLGSARAVSVIDGTLAAEHRGDLKAFGTYWAKDAVFEDPTAGTFKGREKIVSFEEGVYNLSNRFYRISPVIQVGNMAAYALQTTDGSTRWIDVMEFNQDYKITHLWSGFNAEPAG